MDSPSLPPVARWHASYRCRMCMQQMIEPEPCMAYGTLDQVMGGLDKLKVHACRFGRIGVMELEGVVRSPGGLGIGDDDDGGDDGGGMTGRPG